ncbi:MAG TPA: translesion error-prone DNA polymerase V autoproteolytic subunit [Pyrinomonadaceae bacterium]|jgi:DNA polymerase V|nr:translesion error-prone DNA polymerase V autoproteolytic subunit [Pyrinomonadaceae bacterium]
MFSYTDVEAVWRPDGSTRWARPLFMTSVSAGFPSPAESYIEGHLDLNRYLIKHPVATFYVRVSGDSMTGAGIQPGSILVVDRAVEAEDGDIVIARINDELCVKRLRVRGGRIWLMPESDKYQPIEVIESMDFEVWGRVMHAIRSY